MKSRRSFIQRLTALATIPFFSTEKLFARPAFDINQTRGKSPKLRFALASDGHYGQPDTESDKHFEDLVNWLNDDHSIKPLDFVIFNGDLVHDDPNLLNKVKSAYFDKLHFPYYAVPGNHDRCTTQQWKTVFGYEDNHHFEFDNIGIIMANTSNPKGEYVGPDNAYLRNALEKYKSKVTVFVVLHIPPHQWLPQETFFSDSPQTVSLLHQYPNIKAVFHGHDHSLDGVRYTQKLPHFFDGHFGGNWGTEYKGYRIVEISDKDEIFSYQVNASKSPVINKTQLK
jgi:DNA repair exonuclease SbcCD nuclease subunit